MKLTIINPVTDSACELDKAEDAFVREHLMKDTEIEVVYIKQGFPNIENETHVIFNAPPVVLAAKAAYERGNDGLFINCLTNLAYSHAGSCFPSRFSAPVSPPCILRI